MASYALLICHALKSEIRNLKSEIESLHHSKFLLPPAVYQRNLIIQCPEIIDDPDAEETAGYEI